MTTIERMKTVGEKTKKWLENIGTYLGKEGLKAVGRQENRDEMDLAALLRYRLT